jgi:hypothetical protein
LIPDGLLSRISRDSLAAGPAADLTREYLEAGVRLIADALDHDPEQGVHPFLSWLSQRAVVESVNARGNLRGGLGTLRDRWQPHANYLQDLVSWIRYQRPERSFPAREAERIEAAFESHATVSQIIRGLSREVQRGVIQNPLFRLQLLALSVLGSPKYRASTEYRRGAPEIYEEIDKRWLPLVHNFLLAQEAELRRGLDELDLVEMLTAVGEGIALRELADPSSGAKRESRLRLQGTAALALILACLDRGDGLTLDEAVDQH